MVHICTIVPISLTTGANRILPGVAIPYPVGDPDKSMEEEKILRRKIVKASLEALATEIKEQRVFEVNP